jgi:hypothetical protein
LTADLLILRPNAQPPRIDLLLQARPQEEDEEAVMSRILVRPLLPLHLQALGADLEMLALARTCLLLHQLLQLLQVFIQNVLLKSVVAVVVTRCLPLLHLDNHPMGPVIVMDMADSLWVEPTRPIGVPIQVHDKHLEVILVHQPLTPTCQPDQPLANVAMAVEGSLQASTARCNKHRPTCPIQVEATAEGEARHAKPSVVVRMHRS